jgi:biopolymer transport protein ExbD
MAKRTRRRRQRRVIGGFPDLTSFADIAFLLIIYFLLATSFHQLVGLKTDIPSGQKAQEAQADKKTITLSPEGLYWGSRPASIGELRDALRSLKLPEQAPRDRVVQFEAKGGVAWQAYYQVLAAIRTAGGEPGIMMESDQGK